jgi:hypothetical protein
VDMRPVAVRSRNGDFANAARDGPAEAAGVALLSAATHSPAESSTAGPAAQRTIPFGTVRRRSVQHGTDSRTRFGLVSGARADDWPPGQTTRS